MSQNTTAQRAARAVADSKMDRRGPFNPNRQRQPKRMGKGAPPQLPGLTGPIKGPDKGAG